MVSYGLHAQHVEKDIFGDLVYASKDQVYKAFLKRDIFNNLTFTDSNNNQVHYNHQYLVSNYTGIFSNEKVRMDFFRDLLYVNRPRAGYQATYEIDIFGATSITDNLKRGLKIEKDISGHLQYSGKGREGNFSLERNIHGDLEYSVGNARAYLKKDLHQRWVYTDSQGNTLEFSPKTWEMLKRRHKNEEELMLHLVHQFLFI